MTYFPMKKLDVIFASARHCANDSAQDTRSRI